MKGEPYVIEYNARMGDPETEVVVPRLQTDLVALLKAAATGQLSTIKVEVDPRTACTIVAVSGGYPEDYKKGFSISGLAEATATDVSIFHMGTQWRNDQVVTNGGRVLCVTAFGSTVSEAAARAQLAQEKILFEGKYFRRDIGFEFNREKE